VPAQRTRAASITGIAALSALSLGLYATTRSPDHCRPAKNCPTVTSTIGATTSTLSPTTSTTIPAGEILWQALGTSTPDAEWSAWSDDHVTAEEPSSPGALYAGWSHPNMGIDATVGIVLAGKPSYRVFAPVGETRHEFKMAHPVRVGFDDHVFYDGDDVWVAWATLLTAHTTATSWEVFNQFRHINETGLTTSGSPHALGASPDTGTNYNWSDDPNLYSGAQWTYDLGVPIQVGVVVRWTMHFIWSSNETVGLIEVYADGALKMSRHQATLLFNSTTGLPGRAAMRAGSYRDSSLAVNPVEIHFAGITAASDRTTAEAGAFG
jgi:hypothetical protein